MAALLFLVTAGAAVLSPAQEGEGQALRILTAVDDSLPWAAEVREGLAFGAAEASRLAALLQRTVAIESAGRADPYTLRAVLAESGVAAVIAALPSARLRELAVLDPSRPVVAIVEGDHAVAHPQLFTISVADDTVHRAPSLPAGCGSGSVEAWHSSLVRFGAGELNERFARQTGGPMTSAAWAGWTAVKGAVEAAVRAATPDRTLAAPLRRLRFDAHKGRALYFDEAQRLVQPMYHVAPCDGRTRVVEVEP